MSLVVDNLRVYYRTLKGDVRALDGATFSVADGRSWACRQSGWKTTLGKSLIRLDGRMQHMEDGLAGRGRAADRQRLRDERLPLRARVDRPAVCDERAQPDSEDRPDDLELLDSRGVSYDRTLPELSRRLALVGLDDGVLDRYPIELSGGQKQRVVMVLSTLMNPSLLIADELTSALDVSTQKAVAEMLVEFRDREFVKSTIVITHDLSILYQIADTILVTGREGVAGTLTADPATRTRGSSSDRSPRSAFAWREAPPRNHGAATVTPRPAARLPLSGSVSARIRSARKSRRSWRSLLAALLPAGRPTPDASSRTSPRSSRRHLRWRRSAAVSDVTFDIRPGEVVADRRERQRQDNGRQDDPPADGLTTARSRSTGRTSPRSGAAICGATTAASRCLPGPFSSYNPVFKVDRVFEMVRSAYLPGLTRAEWNTRRRRALEEVGLEPADVLGKYPHQLSEGQLSDCSSRARFDIEILVADEIISMLDASTRIDVLNILGDLKERGLGVLFVTHDLALGNYISDRVVILKHGRIVEMGPTPKVFANPVHPYTRMLLTCVPQLTRKWEPTAAEPDDVGTKTLQLDDDHYVEV